MLRRVTKHSARLRRGQGHRFAHAAGAPSSPAGPWVVSPDEHDFEARAARSIHEHGFAILPRLFQKDSLDSLRSAMVGRTDEVLSVLRSRGVALEVGSKAGFHEVVLRSPGRYDVPTIMEQCPKDVLQRIAGVTERVLAAAGGEDGGEGADAHAGAGAGADAAAGAADETAGARGQTLGVAGMVRAEPGSEPQHWHADNVHLTGRHAPANQINVLVAIGDVADEDGPTDIVPGSHVLTNHLRPGAAFGESIVYQNAKVTPECIGSAARPVSASMPEGSALFFDDRVLHRGGWNRGSKTRDVAFFQFRRSGYVPTGDYEATRSLLSYSHRALAAGVRGEFPGLSGGPRGDSDGGASGAGGVPPVFADGASGSQMHESAIAAMVEQMRYGVANMGGAYATSRRAEATVVAARGAMADFLNCAAEEIVFGASMSALTYHVVRAVRSSARLAAGDNVVLDPISHGANVWPWAQVAKACGAEVRWLPVARGAPGDAAGPSECILDTREEALSAVIDERTRLVAAGLASNGVGSIHDVRSLCAAAEALSGGRALRYLDAVHYAPHAKVDVATLGCDMLACSPYKFFGPHSGILFGRRELLAEMPADRLDCQDDGLPRGENCHMSRWEVGTQNYEALAGVAAAVDYIAGLGVRFGGAEAAAPRRLRLEAAWRAVEAHERELKVRFLEGVADVPGLRLLGVADPARPEVRTPTFAVTKAGYSPKALAEALCTRGVWCTSGNHYAGFWDELGGGLATLESGMTRIGFLHYNTLEEVERVLYVLRRL